VVFDQVEPVQVSIINKVRYVGDGYQNKLWLALGYPTQYTTLDQSLLTALIINHEVASKEISLEVDLFFKHWSPFR
jgi:hypothetical protein